MIGVENARMLDSFIVDRMNCGHRKTAFKATVDLGLDEAIALNDKIESFNLKLTEICIRIKHYVSEFI